MLLPNARTTFCLCIVTFLVFTSSLCTVTAQEFRGTYRVVASSIILDSTETSEEAQTVLRFGDTVEVVSRPTSVTFEVRTGEQYFIVQQDAVVRIAQFSDDSERGPVSMARRVLREPKRQEEYVHHTLRVRAGMGPAIPIQSTNVVSTGLLWNAQVDIHIQRSNIHAVFGYHSIQMPSSDSTVVTDSTAPIPSVNERILSFGMIVSVFSNRRPVNPFLGASYGIASTGTNRSYFLLHLGLDMRVSDEALVFLELTPTLSANPVALQWIPVELGFKVEW